MRFYDIMLTLLGKRLNAMTTEFLQLERVKEVKVDLTREEYGRLVIILLREIAIGDIISPHVSQIEARAALTLLDSIATDEQRDTEEKFICRAIGERHSGEVEVVLRR